MKNLLLIAVILVITSCKHKADQKSNKQNNFEKFTGRWTLDVVESKANSNSTWVERQDHYKNRKGFIIYDGKGGMGVHHVVEDYENYEFEGKGGLDNMTYADLRHIAGNFVYFGKYRLNDSLNTIEHHIESSIIPRQWGTVIERNYEFKNDTLILYPVRNKYPKTRLKWVKLNDDE